MGPCSCAFSSAAASQPTQFLRTITFVALIGILISPPFSTVRALPSPSATANGDVMHNNSSRPVVDNSTTGTELGASSSKKIVDGSETMLHERRHRHLNKFPASSFVRETLQGQREQRKKSSKKARNLRKFSSQFGCLANPHMCYNMPGWTPESSASTCCSDGFCTDILFDGMNCGACGNECFFGHFCCSGTCVATSIDPSNCGVCGNVCASGVCDFGFCAYH